MDLTFRRPTTRRRSGRRGRGTAAEDATVEVKRQKLWGSSYWPRRSLCGDGGEDSGDEGDDIDVKEDGAETGSDLSSGGTGDGESSEDGGDGEDEGAESEGSDLSPEGGDEDDDGEEGGAEGTEMGWDLFPSRSRSGESSEDGEDGGGSEEGGAGEEPGGGRGLEASAGGGGSSSELMSLFVDPDVLDCPICFENLAPPVFQCNNGHIACSSCCVKVKSCPFCFHLINVRCLAIEKVVESIKIHCAYASSGCGEIVSYVHRHVHKETCIYSPCYCPTAECTFEGPIQKLYHHFSSTHGHCAISFQYNLSFVACLPEDEAFRILRGEDGVLFLLLNKSEPPIFKAIIVACLGPDSMKEDYTYQVVARGKESSIQFESSMMNIRHREGVLPPTGFLLIPQGFYEVYLSLEIIVRKKASHIGSIITA